MIARPRMILVVMVLGGILDTGPAAFAQDNEHQPGGFDCAYQSPERVRQAINAAVAAGTITDPMLRVLPRVAPRTIQPGDTVRGGGVPTVTQTDIFQFEDTVGLLLTSFSDGDLFDLMGAASNAVMAAHGDNYDFIGFFVNFVPDHQIGSAFYLGLENDVTGIGRAIFEQRAALGIAGANIEGLVMMWRQSSWSSGLTNVTQLVLAQEFEHRFAMFLSPLLDGRQLQGTTGCGRGSHWNFRVDAQGSGMEVAEWTGAPTATRVLRGAPFTQLLFNADIGGVFSYPDLYLMGYVSGPEMDAGASELRYMNDNCTSPYSGTISTWTSADIVAANGARIPDSTTAQKDFRTAWVMIHQPASPPTIPQLNNVVAILNDWSVSWNFGTLSRGTMDNTLVRDCNANGIPDPDDIAGGTSTDCNANGNPDECEPDCNNNAVADECDITAGTSADCNADGIPDECDPDCQPNGIPDGCDIFAGTSADCNANGTPDECEPQDDCNNNLVQDICDLAAGTSLDCNANDVPDECDIATGTSQDCNTNGIPDECDPQDDCNNNLVQDICDLAAGTSADCNGNAFPDECDVAGGGTLIDADFETGLPLGWSVSGIFQATTSCGVDPACDGAAWAYAGNTASCTYGDHEVGELVSPPITLGPTVSELRYCSLVDTELNFDFADVLVNGSLLDRQSGTGGIWGERVIDLTSFRGQTVTITFHLESDAFVSGTRGWLVDRVRVISGDPDSDGDLVPDSCDNCPNDPLKTDPGVCGCGIAENLTDSDGDATPDCIDACPNEPALVNPSEPGTELTCDDTIDNDCDGLTDATDPDCVFGCSRTCGDINGTGGNVDLVDFAAFALCFNKTAPVGACPDPVTFACSDLDANGATNLLDFATFSLLFGTTSTNVPPNCP